MNNSGTYYALLIAINHYTYLDDLEAPVRDAEALKQVLIGEYGFAKEHIATLYNDEATYEGIRQVLEQYETIGSSDTLLISYAGHGKTDDYDKMNFWLPHDAEEDNTVRVKWMPNTTVIAAMARSRARHVLLLNDSCYSGDFVGASRDLREKEDGYLEKALLYQAREVITSGMSEIVSDSSLQGHSPFMYHLLRGLRNHGEPYIDTDQMYEYVKRGVKGQRPLHRIVPGHQDGGLVVLYRQGRIPVPSRVKSGTEKHEPNTARTEKPSVNPVPPESSQPPDAQDKETPAEKSKTKSSVSPDDGGTQKPLGGGIKESAYRSRKRSVRIAFWITVIMILAVSAGVVILRTDNLPYGVLKVLPELLLSEGQRARREVGGLLEEGEHEQAFVVATAGLQSGALDQEAYEGYREEIAGSVGAGAEAQLTALLEESAFSDAGVLLEQGVGWLGEELNEPLRQELAAVAAAWTEESVATLEGTGAYVEAYLQVRALIEAGVLDAGELEGYRRELERSVIAGVEQAVRNGSYTAAYRILDSGVEEFVTVAPLRELVGSAEEEALLAAVAAWEEQVPDGYGLRRVRLKGTDGSEQRDALLLDGDTGGEAGSGAVWAGGAVGSGAYLLITSEPELGAVVKVDGREIGQTPLLIEDLEAGVSVAVEARKGTQYGSVEAVTERMQLTEAAVLLEQERGNLAVLTGEDGLKILLDGKEYGETGSGVLEDVAAGRYAVEITGEGWYYRGPVEIAAEETTWVRPELQAVGVLEVEAQVSGSVEIRGEEPVELEAGEVYLSEQVPVGTKLVSFRYANGLQELREVKIEQGKRSTVSFSKTFGTLKVSTATGGTVYVDGIQRGSVQSGSFLEIPNLETGRRSVEIRYADTVTTTRDIALEQDTTTRLAFADTFGTLRVQAATPGNLYLDGQIRAYIPADKPVDIDYVEPGMRQAEIVYENGSRERQTVEILKSGKSAAVFIHSFGTLEIYAASAGRVMLDKEKGEEREIQANGQLVVPLIRAGEQTVRITYQNGQVVSRLVRVAPEAVTSLRFSETFGNVRVSSITGGTLLVDDLEIRQLAGGDSTTVAAEAGKRTISMRYANGVVESYPAEVRTDEVFVVNFTRGFGNAVIVLESSGTLLFNNKEIGYVPGGAAEHFNMVDAGVHAVSVAYPDGHREYQSVQVLPGEGHFVHFTYEMNYYVGDRGPAGGLIFYDKGYYRDGWRFLEAAPPEAEIQGIPWGGAGYAVDGTGSGLGDGKQNTASIVTAYGDKEPYAYATQYAAKLCDELVWRGYDDWFLPSRAELNLMYENLGTRDLGDFRVAFFLANELYWSSSESDREEAWSQVVDSGSAYTYDKDEELNVRPVRAF